MTKWEYASIVLPTKIADDDEECMNAMGAEGWELVNVHGRIAYFRRKKTVGPSERKHFVGLPEALEGRSDLKFPKTDASSEYKEPREVPSV